MIEISKKVYNKKVDKVFFVFVNELHHLEAVDGKINDSVENEQEVVKIDFMKVNIEQNLVIDLNKKVFLIILIVFRDLNFQV